MANNINCFINLLAMLLFGRLYTHFGPLRNNAMVERPIANPRFSFSFSPVDNWDSRVIVDVIQAVLLFFFLSPRPSPKCSQTPSSRFLCLLLLLLLRYFLVVFFWITTADLSRPDKSFTLFSIIFTSCLVVSMHNNGVEWNQPIGATVENQKLTIIFIGHKNISKQVAYILYIYRHSLLLYRVNCNKVKNIQGLHCSTHLFTWMIETLH